MIKYPTVVMLFMLSSDFSERQTNMSRRVFGNFILPSSRYLLSTETTSFFPNSQVPTSMLPYLNKMPSFDPFTFLGRFSTHECEFFSSLPKETATLNLSPNFA